MKKAYLVLANGMSFEGVRFGAEGDALGELVFTTGMCGYIETLTDPSFYGQIVMHTFPMIGNYGIIPEDFEGECAVAGYVVREHCETPSNFRCAGDLDTFLKAQNVVGLYGIDTREVTRIIREHGVMNAKIVDEIPDNIDDLKSYEVKNAVSSVSCKKQSVYPAEGEEKSRVALIDYGAKRNIIRSLTMRGCRVTVYPSNVDAKTILAEKPDGLMLSNGPGDPTENREAIETLKALIGKLPIFGICLGHQLLALAMGGQTMKLKYGHRGANQPAKETDGVRTFITSQNHGYAVLSESLKAVGKELFTNANDGTCEGMVYEKYNAFSVQFHPEACSGPLDTAFLFDRFIDNMNL